MARETVTEVDRLPDFVIAGAMKSGTTSLQKALSKHPEVYCPPGEPHFFCEHPRKDIAWYKNQFRDAGEARLLGDKSPDYLYNPRAAERMAQLLPDARVIIMLRNPVDRAYSHYWQERRLKYERLSFVDALHAEPERLRNGESRFGYIDMGRYAPQLERLASFFPRSSIHVVLFEHFKASAGDVYAGVCRFLGIDDTRRPAVLQKRTNEFRHTRVPRLYERYKHGELYGRLPRIVRRRIQKVIERPAEYPPMSDELRARLTEVFAPNNAALAAWLEAKLTVWET